MLVMATRIDVITSDYQVAKYAGRDCSWHWKRIEESRRIQEQP